MHALSNKENEILKANWCCAAGSLRRSLRVFGIKNSENNYCCGRKCYIVSQTLGKGAVFQAAKTCFDLNGKRLLALEKMDTKLHREIVDKCEAAKFNALKLFAEWVHNGKR